MQRFARRRMLVGLTALFGVFVLSFELRYIVPYVRQYRGGAMVGSPQQRFWVSFERKSASEPVNATACFEDPLDDGCPYGLTGFPTKPLTIKEAKMCDEKMQPMLNHNRELRCETDPTCVQCRGPQLRKTKELYAAFNSESRKRDRLIRLNRWFRKESELPVIVSAVNYGQLYLFLNWANSCIVNGVMDPRERMWVIPTDKRAFEVISGFGFYTEPVDWLKELKVRISENYRGGANVGGHALINSVTVFAANLLLELGEKLTCIKRLINDIVLNRPNYSHHGRRLCLLERRLPLPAPSREKAGRPRHVFPET